MCFKKWFGKPPLPVQTLPMPDATRRLITVAINDYPGSANDLRGCINDSRQIKDTLTSFWPDFDVHRLIDVEASVQAFSKLVETAISKLSPGATVLVLSDSCFSGTVTRFNFQDMIKFTNRYYQNPELFDVQYPKKAFTSKDGMADMKWIAISGCGETQYSADAFIGGDYHGAFTYYAMNSLLPGMTYYDWFNKIRTILPNAMFEQAPDMEGPEELKNRVVCMGETLIIHNSTHGTQMPGSGGSDEPIDEAICFYDGNLRDDDYNQLLNKIP